MQTKPQCVLLTSNWSESKRFINDGMGPRYSWVNSEHPYLAYWWNWRSKTLNSNQHMLKSNLRFRKAIRFSLPLLHNSTKKIEDWVVMESSWTNRRLYSEYKLAEKARFTIRVSLARHRDCVFVLFVLKKQWPALVQINPWKTCVCKRKEYSRRKLVNCSVTKGQWIGVSWTRVRIDDDDDDAAFWGYISLTGTCCRLLCHLAVAHGISCLAVEMHPLLRWQPVHLSSVGWWLFWGFLGHALHPRPPGGEAGHTDKSAHLPLQASSSLETLCGLEKSTLGALECCVLFGGLPRWAIFCLVSKSFVVQFNSNVCTHVCMYVFVCMWIICRELKQWIKVTGVTFNELRGCLVYRD